MPLESYISYYISLGLNFPICNMGIKIVPIPLGGCGDEIKKLCQDLTFHIDKCTLGMFRLHFN